LDFDVPARRGTPATSRRLVQRRWAGSEFIVAYHERAVGNLGQALEAPSGDECGR
jgi:hypothetical protein